MVFSNEFVYNFLKQNNKNFLRVKDLKSLAKTPREVFIFHRNALDLLPDEITSYQDLDQLRFIISYLGNNEIKMQLKNDPTQTWTNPLSFLNQKKARCQWASKASKNGQTLVGWRGPIIKIKPNIFKKNLYANKPLNV